MFLLWGSTKNTYFHNFLKINITYDNDRMQYSGIRGRPDLCDTARICLSEDKILLPLMLSFK
jgi:hypothetical protein